MVVLLLLEACDSQLYTSVIGQVKILAVCFEARPRKAPIDLFQCGIESVVFVKEIDSSFELVPIIALIASIFSGMTIDS